MSDPDPTTPAERLRRIEEETDQLDRHIDEAREAVRRATKAESMAMPGDERGEGSVGSVGGRADEEDEEYREDEGRGEQDQGGTDRTE
ncbi:hypothetical protein [Actinospica robiniae]|uniref:hypothetical protein n=1 Tax=Actinospica robiniae TaxID=304901 RepID=UPI00041C352C|nr:hypothetical protein [Actinospica robiniae]